MSDGNTDVLDPEVDTSPNQEAIDQGIQDAENYANQGDDTGNDDNEEDNNNDSPEDRRNKKNTRDDPNNKKNKDTEQEPNKKGKPGNKGKAGKEAAKGEKKAAEKAAKGAAKSGAKAGARTGTRVAAESALAATGVADFGISTAAAIAIEAAYQAARHPKKTVKYIIFLIFLVFGFFAWLLYAYNMLAGISGHQISQREETTSLLTLTKTGPTEGTINQELVYTITVGYPNPTQDITVTDEIPQGVEYVRSSNKVTYNATSRTVTWKARDNIASPVAATDPLPVINTTFTITLRATQNNITIFNIARGTAIPAAASSFNGQNIPPSTNDCGMPEYRRYMNMTPDKMNYGDPTCTYIKTDPNGKKIFDKDTLLTMLQTQDPTRAKEWFCLAGAESGHGNPNPNAYLGNSTSGRGAYGFYQMNPGGGSGTPGQYDNGNVVWQLQISNAINYNNYLITKGNTWDYWDPRSRAPCGI